MTSLEVEYLTESSVQIELNESPDDYLDAIESAIVVSGKKNLQGLELQMRENLMYILEGIDLRYSEINSTDIRPQINIFFGTDSKNTDAAWFHKDSTDGETFIFIHLAALALGGIETIELRPGIYSFLNNDKILFIGTTKGYFNSTGIEEADHFDYDLTIPLTGRNSSKDENHDNSPEEIRAIERNLEHFKSQPDTPRETIDFLTIKLQKAKGQES